jgi:hypothetical protein
MKGGGEESQRDVEEFVYSECQCGHKGGAKLKHYGLMRCKCGRFQWALRPRRFGPLVAYPWPGDSALNRAK